MTMPSVKFKHDDADNNATCDGPTSSDANSPSTWDELFFVTTLGLMARGRSVSVDTAGVAFPGREIVDAPASANTPIVGILMEVPTAGDWVRVRRRGIIDEATDGFRVNVLDTTAANLYLRQSAVAGQLNTATIGTDHVVALNLALATPTGSPRVEVRC